MNGILFRGPKNFFSEKFSKSYYSIRFSELKSLNWPRFAISFYLKVAEHIPFFKFTLSEWNQLHKNVISCDFLWGKCEIWCLSYEIRNKIETSFYKLADRISIWIIMKDGLKFFVRISLFCLDLNRTYTWGKECSFKTENGKYLVFFNELQRVSYNTFIFSLSMISQKLKKDQTPEY